MDAPTDAPTRDLGPGEVVRDWQIERKLANGGFGTIYVAHHRRSRARGALKILHRHLTGAIDIVARFEREIAVIRMLDHPNIVRLLDAGMTTEGRPYLCTELIEGEDVLHTLSQVGHLSPAEAVDLLGPICDALDYAHANHVVHRDLKASNVVASQTQVVLLDFGIAKLVDSFATAITDTAHPVGTPSCMAPEQINGGRVDARTDVYALGALLFHVLTGRRAFSDPSPTMTQYLHLNARRPRASALVPLPSRFDDIIIRAMSVDPAKRHASAGELLADARAAARASAAYPTFQHADAAAILATVSATGGSPVNDAALLADLEAAMPEIERWLGAAGFALTVDFGSSAMFASRIEPDAALEVALDTWARLCKITRHPRLQIGLCVHAGDLIYAGGELQPSPLLRPATWNVPEVYEGVWVTHAIEPDARGGKRVA
jgi:hypothetical protein